MPRYDFKPIESRWQQYWDEHQTFKTEDRVSDKRKLYVLDMFPYPSGSGLHVGHPEGYTATDIVCRYSRMRGLSFEARGVKVRAMRALRDVERRTRIVRRALLSCRPAARLPR